MIHHGSRDLRKTRFMQSFTEDNREQLQRQDAELAI
jgi:hypothetical protein